MSSRFKTAIVACKPPEQDTTSEPNLPISVSLVTQDYLCNVTTHSQDEEIVDFTKASNNVINRKEREIILKNHSKSNYCSISTESKCHGTYMGGRSSNKRLTIGWSSDTKEPITRVRCQFYSLCLSAPQSIVRLDGCSQVYWDQPSLW